MEFTPEQQEHINGLIAEKSKGLYSEDDLNKKVESEVDRRVQSGIETHKLKWQSDFEAKAKLTAGELAQQELQDRMDQLSNKEVELLKRENRSDAIESLSGANIPKEQYSKFIDILISDNAETTNTNVANFIDTFNSTKNDIETNIRKELSGIPSPKVNPGGAKVPVKSVDMADIMQRANIRNNI